MCETSLERACELVHRAQRIVAFTGAGISAESGIPTYRDAEESLWKQYDPDKVVNIHYFQRDPKPYWHFFREQRYIVMSRARPNAGHIALAEMEQTGRLRAVITQNIDGLHQAAGSQKVIELHGNTRTIGCLRCEADHTMEEVYAQLETTFPPVCRECGGGLKPRVVFFGESLPRKALLAAAEEARATDLLIAIGSSLQVYPAAAVPSEARRAGAKLLIVNKTPTPFDDMADGVLRAAAGRVLPKLAAVLSE